MKLYQGETRTDFSNSCIYRIYCLDPEIKDIYVGSTTNFRNRYLQHRLNCISEKKAGHNFPVYVFMRENGGVDNWEMEIIEKYSCKTKKELLIKEREWYEKLNPTLNSVIPCREKKEYYELNKEVICEKMKNYRKENPEKILISNKKAYEKNGEKYLEQSKKYYQKNREQILERERNSRKENPQKFRDRDRQRRINNIEKFAEKDKRYYEKNQEKILETKKEYYQKNKEKLNEKVECECGGKFSRKDKSRHLKTKKHQKYLSTIKHE